jgi:hypothetical protein
MRALFARAERAGLLTKNPARELDEPRQRASRRRALDDSELAEAVDAIRTTSRDPDLVVEHVLSYRRDLGRGRRALRRVAAERPAARDRRHQPCGTA